MAELGPHLLDGGDDALIVSRQEPHDGELERCCVDRRVVESAHEGASIGVDPTDEHRRVDLLPFPFPFGDGRVLAEQFRQAQPAVERYPAHDLRVHEMPRPVAGFPDAVVCSAPVRGGEADEGAHRRPQIPRSSPVRSANAKAASTT